MLCNEFLIFDHKKQKRPLSILGLNVFLTSFNKFEILPVFYQTKRIVFCKLLILLIKNGGGGGS
ncbi:MAG: hypothetical protein DRH26_04740 [Deltaproteobacteria bacterium]|nr:MAG: hypothetical protein DRH26_04740 [Deltaproteobacteria bacterium]